MIYKLIQNKIEEILSDTFNLPSEEILIASQVPNDDIDFFVRSVFSYGNLNEVGNLNFEEISTLTLEVYERKYLEETKIDTFVTSLRKELLSLKPINDENDKSRAKIIQVTLNRNDQDNWKSFNLILSIRIRWENE